MPFDFHKRLGRWVAWLNRSPVRRHGKGTAAWGALWTALAGAAVLILPWFEWLSNLSYDLGFLFRSEIRVQDVVIVYMDEESQYKFGMEYFKKWDRKIHASLVNRLTEWKAKAVAFDLLFLASTNSPESDEALVEAVKANGQVVMAGRRDAWVVEGEILGSKLLRPFPALEAQASWGIVEEAGDENSIRQHYQGNPEYPSLAWRVAEKTMDNPPSPNLDRWVNYYGRPGIVTSFQYWDVLQAAPALASAFSNKVVFVGAQFDVGFTGGKGTDDFFTPYSRWTRTRSPGVEINATTYLNLLRGDWLERLSPAVELSLVLLAGAALGWLLSGYRPVPAAGLGAALAFLVSAVCLLFMWQKQTWFPWLVVSAVEFPTALAWSVLAHSKRMTHELRALEQEMALERVRAQAQQSATLQVARPRIPPKPGEWTGAAPQHPIVPEHTLLRVFARGAYGEVWLARDVIGTYRAVKILHRLSFPTEKPYEREFRGIAKFSPISLSHRGFVPILQVGRNDAAGCIYYIMELADDVVAGQAVDPDTYAPRTLASDVKAKKRLPLADCLDIMAQLANALEFLHQQRLIHRDIKPSNIIFVKGVPKFADIGLVTDLATQNRDVSYLGTQGYIAPEGPGTTSADVYSLGKVIYEAGFGMDPKRFPELPTDLIEDPGDSGVFELNRIILKACEHDRDHRYHSAAELLADLEKLRLQVHPKGA